MFLAQATVKRKPPPPCTIKTQTPAQKRLPKEKYELQNEEEFTSPWFEKNLGSLTRTKESRPYHTDYQVMYVDMIMPLDIAVGRTRIFCDN